MATELEKKPGVPRYEAFIDEQLTRVRTRMRALDAGRTVLMLGVVTLAYFLLAALFDLAVRGADDAVVTGVRLTALGVYAALVLVLLGQLAVRLYRRINPYYAARRLEEIIPDAKNSVINWLDLKGETLPGAIRNAVGQRAARELKESDPDKAVNAKGNWVLAGILAGLCLGVLVLFAMGPNQFGSLVRRAFLTPLFTRLDTKTEITLLRPAQGNVTVPLGQHADFQAQIEGRFPRAGQPGAPRLLYRYQASDPYVALPLDEALDGTWTATLVGDQVQNGLWYRIAAGDTETPEYQVKVQSLPQATRFEITYRYRPYRKLAEQTVVFPNDEAVWPRIKEYRGTEVKVLVRANRELRAARIELDSGGTKTDLPGVILADDPRAFWVDMKLEKRGSFRVRFTSQSGEENTDRSPYSIEVLDDQAPRVVLTQPGKDGALPLGGTLQLKGFAQDDIGLRSLALRLKVLEGETRPSLKPKVYREGKSFQFDNGTYPDFLEYQDFVVLEKLATVQGEPLPLKAGMVLEYWLEATDNSDYPSKDGNVGKSQAFKLTILPSDNNQNKDDKKKAEAEQKKHEQKQDQQNAKENQKRNDAGAKNDGQAGSDSGQDNKQKQDFEQKLDQVRNALNKDKNKNNEKKDKSASNTQEPKSADNKPDQTGENNNPPDKSGKDPGQTEGSQGSGKKDDGKQGEGSSSAQPKENGKKDHGAEPAKTKGQDAGKPEPAPKGNDTAKPDNSAKTKGNQDGQGGKKPQPKADNPKGTGGQEGNKTPNKAGTKDDASKVQKKGTGQDARPEATGKKDSGAQPDAKNGAAKGKEAGKDADSSGQPQNNQASKKETGKKSDTGAKDGTGNEENANKANADKDPPNQTNPRTATAKDVDELKKKLEGESSAKEAHDKLSRAAKEAKDPAERQAAQEALKKLEREAQANHDDLERLAKEANDPKVRKAAQDALDELNHEAQAASNTLPQPKKDGEASEEPSTKNGSEANTSPMPKVDGAKNDATTGKADTQKVDAQKPDAQKADPQKGDPQKADSPGAKAGNGKSPSGGKIGNSGPSGTGVSDDISKRDPDSEFNKRGGDLQLEDLKKRMTPETLKKLGWSNEDWQRFLKDAENYQKALRNSQAGQGNMSKKGTTSQIPNAGIRRIDRDPNAPPEPLQVDRALPPPEFREAQRQFTSPPPK
jgi:hypothetical protein